MNQNVTVRLHRDIIRKAKVLAARRDTSLSGLLADQIEALANQEDALERAERLALALLERPFRLGRGKVTRESLHER